MWNRIDKFLLIIGIFNIILFLGFIGAIYGLGKKSLLLDAKISHNSAKIDYNNATLRTERHKEDILNKIYQQNFEIINLKLAKKEKQISIMEESIDPKNKRWALIKRVREVVEKYASPKMKINDYTYIASAIIDYSETYDVPVPLILAVSRRESAFNPKAKSHAGAMGIMQVMSYTAAEVAGEINKRKYNLYNARHSIDIGTYYLWKMLDRFDGNTELAVRAYNAGPTFVEKVISGDYKNYPEETILYHQYVMKYKKEFEELGL